MTQRKIAIIGTGRGDSTLYGELLEILKKETELELEVLHMIQSNSDPDNFFVPNEAKLEQLLKRMVVPPWQYEEKCGKLLCIIVAEPVDDVPDDGPNRLMLYGSSYIERFIVAHNFARSRLLLVLAENYSEAESIRTRHPKILSDLGVNEVEPNGICQLAIQLLDLDPDSYRRHLFKEGKISLDPDSIEEDNGVVN